MYPKPYKQKNFLIQKYIRERKSTLEIAKECGVNPETIREWLLKHGVRRRTKKEIDERKAFIKRYGQTPEEAIKDFVAGKDTQPKIELPKESLQQRLDRQQAEAEQKLFGKNNRPAQVVKKPMKTVKEEMNEIMDNFEPNLSKQSKVNQVIEQTLVDMGFKPVFEGRDKK